MALKDIPDVFDVDSEEDLRFAVACYFADLGFAAEELSFEDQFRIRLGHNVVIVGQENKRHNSVRGRSDLLLIRDGRPLAVVETKAPDHDLTEEDAWQAISYARLLLTMAPFAIVTNGHDTRIYDPYASSLRNLDSAQDSLWCQHGQNVSAIAEDLRYEASKLLIGLNSQTLQSFCTGQAVLALTDLKGGPHEGSLYIPSVYTPRKSAAESLETWLASDEPCFAIVADSGTGKTNFMCASAEALVARDCVLFYQAGRLPAGGLMEAIRSDFVWEFHQERDTAYIVDRLDSVASAYSRQLVIFLDALDEFPGGQEFLRNELLDFVVRIRGRAVKLCLSCKSYDWPNFVIERGQYYNSLAKAIWPSEKLTTDRIDPRKVGIWLRGFTDAELDEAYGKYKSEFALTGDLEGPLRVECQTPIMLRFVAEAYQLHDADLPDDVTSNEVYRRYWQRRLGLVRHQRVAESLVGDVAQLAVDSGSRAVGLTKLQGVRDWTGIVYETYGDLLRVGFLREFADDLGVRSVAFGFDRMRSYVYLEMVRCWRSLLPEEVAAEVLALMSRPLGLETVVLYLTVIDRGQTRLLTELALRDLFGFVKLVTLDLRSPLAQSVLADQVSDALLDRLVRYAEAYSEISRRYFGSLCEWIEPYTELEVGIWVCDGGYQFRGRTEAYPEAVVLLPREVAKELWVGNESEDLRQQLRPGGTMYMGMADFHEKLPHQIAWERLLKQLDEVLTSRLLAESDAAVLLGERVWDMLVYEPSMWFGGSTEAHIHYWQLLGFESPSDLVGQSVSELRELANKLLRDYSARVPRNTRRKDLSSNQRESLHRVEELQQLHYWLGQLTVKCADLSSMPYSLEDYFSYVKSGIDGPVLQIVRAIVPEILQAYRSMVLSNFPQFSSRFALFQADPSQIAVEVNWNPRDTTWHTDYLTLAFIVLSSVELPTDYIVFTCDKQESVANLPLVPSPGVVTHGGNYGTGVVTLKLHEVVIEDQPATVYLTQFPSHHPILDQVYQLISSELRSLLGGNRMFWNTGIGRTGSRRQNWWFARQYALHRASQDPQGVL